MKDYETIYLWGKEVPQAYLLRNRKMQKTDSPCMLVVPGGGYGTVCMETEGYPIAERFAKLGFQTFILSYRVFPDHFPNPQQDLFRAIRLIRHHAKEWKVIPDNLAICGFSAGGHLCACAGTLFDFVKPEFNDAVDREKVRPDAVLLSYPVISSGRFAHKGSFLNLLGDRYEELKEQFSLEKQVTAQSSPMFLWHTAQDGTVPYKNSVMMADALMKHHVPMELHLYPFGQHGMTLGIGTEDISRWPENAVAFLKGTLKFQI